MRSETLKTKVEGRNIEHVKDDASGTGTYNVLSSNGGILYAIRYSKGIKNNPKAREEIGLDFESKIWSKSDALSLATTYSQPRNTSNLLQQLSDLFG